MYLVDMDEFFVMMMVRDSNKFGSIQVSAQLALLHTQNRRMKTRLLRPERPSTRRAHRCTNGPSVVAPCFPARAATWMGPT
jgi:hypothetical protein